MHMYFYPYILNIVCNEKVMLLKFTSIQDEQEFQTNFVLSRDLRSNLITFGLLFYFFLNERNVFLINRKNSTLLHAIYSFTKI